MKATKYLVDGVPMSFYRQTHENGHAYWYGHYRRNGKRGKRYMGREDPRPRYAIYEPPLPPTGLTWLYGGLRKQLGGHEPHSSSKGLPAGSGGER